jgi:hypothetical protein
MKEHLENCIVCGEVESLDGYASDVWFKPFVIFYDEVFFRTFYNRNGVFYVVLQYIGPAENAAKYKYNVEFVTKDNTKTVPTMHLARSFDEECDKILESQGCWKLHSDVLGIHGTRQRRLKYKLQIFEVCD